LFSFVKSFLRLPVLEPYFDLQQAKSKSLAEFLEKCVKRGHLSVSESQGCGQLSAIRFGDVFLQLEPFLQALALQIGENGSGPRSLAVGRTGTVAAAAATASATATSGMLFSRIRRSDRFR
jgi:hypothetical protein